MSEKNGFAESHDIADDDRFICEFCAQDFDIEDSVAVDGVFACAECVERERKEVSDLRGIDR